MYFHKGIPALLLTAGLTLLPVSIVSADVTAPPADTSVTPQNGWGQDTQGKFYTTPDGSRAAGLYTVDGHIYFFRENGYLYLPESAHAIAFQDNYYYVKTDGTVKTGLFSARSSDGIYWYFANSKGKLTVKKVRNINGSVYCFGAKGRTLSPGLRRLNGKKYLIGTNGIAKVGRQKYNDKVYFFGKNGAMLTGRFKYEDTLYFTNKKGTLAKKGWAKSNSKSYYVNADGTLYTGWKSYRGKWYYLDRRTGVKAVNKWVTKNGKKCFMGKDGSLQTGWFRANGRKYYASTHGTDIGVPYTGVLQMGSKIYVFDSKGRLGNGWTIYSGRTYYTNSKGEITRGFKKIGGKYYYFNDYGVMRTGWLCYNGNFYYLNPSDGSMVTGTKTIGGKTYTFSKSGAASNPLEGSWTVKVNRQQNVVTVYKGNTPVRSMLCSTGLNNATPLGTFIIRDKLPTHLLNGPTYGYYCSHITDDILFHSIPQHDLGRQNLPAYKYNMLGMQASQGCIRLGMGDAYWLYNNVPIGSTVIVYDSSDPGPLGKPRGIRIPESQVYDPTDPLYFNTGL